MALPSCSGLPSDELRAFLEATSNGVWESDLHQQVTYLSEGWYAALGYAAADFAPAGSLNAWFAIVHPEDLTALQAADQRLAAGTADQISLELRVRDAANAWRWMRLYGRVVEWSADRAPLRILGSQQEITAPKQLAAELDRCRQLNGALQQVVPGLLCSVDAEGVVTECLSLGPDPLPLAADPTGRSLAELVPASVAAPLVAAIRRSAETQEEQTFAYQLPTGGTGRDFEVRLFPHGPGQTRCLLRDVTEQRGMDRRLAETQSEYERLLRSLPVGVFRFRLGADGAVREAFVSPRLAEVTHQPLDVLRRGQDAFADYIHPADLGRALAAVECLCTRETVVREDIRCLDAADAVVWVRLDLQSTVCANGERCIHGTASDVTAQKRSEEEFQQLQVRLQRTERMRAIGQLAGGVAHEFNNQLASVFFFVDSVKKGTLGTRQLHRYADLLRNGAERISELTQKLLDFSRQGSPKREIFDVHDVLRESLDILEQTLGCRIRVVRELLAPHSILLGDRAQISSAVLNLAINARDAMAGVGTLTVSTVCVTLDEEDCRRLPHENGFGPGTYIRLSVADTGEGMDAVTRERIFEPFFTTKPVGKGTGLGLAVVYGTMTDHGGAITVDSERGKGTTFHLFLPLCDLPSPQDATPATTCEVVPGTGHLLLVDDEMLLRVLLRDQLEEIGYKVTECAGGREAIRVLSESPGAVDGLILDVAMPDLSGLETYRALRQIRQNLPTLVITGFANHPDVPLLMEEGANDLVPKPADLGVLSQRLALLLQRPANGNA